MKCSVDAEINEILKVLKEKYGDDEAALKEAEEWLRSNGSGLYAVRDLNNFTEDYKKFDGRKLLERDDPLTKFTIAMETANMYTKQSIQTAATSLLEVSGAKDKVKDAHNAVYGKNALYKATWDMVNDVYENNELLQQTRTWLGVAKDKFSRTDLNKFLTVVLMSKQKRNENDNAKVEEVQSLLRKEFGGKVPTKMLDDIFGKAGVYALMMYGDGQTLDNIIDGKWSIDYAIGQIQNTLGTGNVLGTQESAKAVYTKLGEGLGLLYVGEKSGIAGGEQTYAELKNNVMNALQMTAYGSKEFEAVSMIASLHALKHIDGAQELLRSMKKHQPKSLNELKSLAVANAATTFKMYEMNEDVMNIMQRGNLVRDVYQTPVELEMITLNDVRDQKYTEQDGWKILRMPSKNDEGVQTPGFVYRKKTGGYQEGIGLNVGYTSNGYKTSVLPEGITEDSPGVSTFRVEKSRAKTGNDTKVKDVRTTYVVNLTMREKRELGLIEDPAHTLVRSIGHNKEVIDMKVVRDEILKERFTFKVVDATSLDELESIIKDENKENPWYLNTRNVDLSKWSKEDVARYHKILRKYNKSKHVTEIGGLRDELTYTRKDLQHMLDGYMDLEPNNYKYRVMLNVLKKVISWTKIQQVIVNPSKIAMDFASNTSLLMTMGVSPMDIKDGYTDAVTGIKEMTKLRNEYIGMELQELGITDKVELKAHQIRMKRLDKKIRQHPMAPMLFNGMIQSIGTDITLKSYDSISGLDHDMKMAIKKLVRDENGDLNALGQNIMKVANAGIDMTEVVRKFGEFSKNSKITTPFGEVLENFAKNIQRAKSEEDVEKYVGEFLGAPGSELVKLGSAMVQWSDVLPRVTLYRHLKRKFAIEGMNEKEAEEKAVIETLDTFIDYKMNMPPEIKLLSDTFFLMYPSFWMKIQRVIYGLAKNHPLGLGTAMLTAEMLNTNGLHVMGSNVFRKASNGTLIDAPELSDLTFFFLF